MSYAVAIPAYNAAETLAEALQSVLSQTIPPTEVIVVDDGSTDETSGIARKFGGVVQVLRTENSGCGAATTRAIRATTRSIVATLDADDLWLPDKMAHQLATLQDATEPTLIFSRVRQFRHGTPDDGTGEERDGLSRSTLVMHRAHFEQVGDIFDPPGGCGDMVDWLGRARGAGCQFKMIPQVLALRRIIATSLTYRMDDERRRGFLVAAHRALLRKRAGEKPE